jgi:hypothetical protein
MYIVWISDEIFCRQKKPKKYSVNISWVHFIYVWFCSRISLLIFYLNDLSIGNRGILNSLTTTVLESICTFKCFRVCLMKLDALTFVHRDW